jgi:hypothetical protein
MKGCISAAEAVEGARVRRVKVRRNPIDILRDFIETSTLPTT